VILRSSDLDLYQSLYSCGLGLRMTPMAPLLLRSLDVDCLTPLDLLDLSLRDGLLRDLSDSMVV
jgi:hypothetical protein